MEQSRESRSRGRPRSFDEAEVLDRAVKLFSEIGFSAAAIGDLTAATGLSAGSLYKAFGDKEGMFGKALARYVAVRDAALGTALASGETGRERIAAVLLLYSALSQGDEGRCGCMIVAGIAEIDLVGDDAAELMRQTLVRRRDLLAELVRTGQRDGSISSTAEPTLTADLLLNIVQGMRVVGKSGLFAADASAIVRLALKLLD